MVKLTADLQDTACKDFSITLIYKDEKNIPKIGDDIIMSCFFNDQKVAWGFVVSSIEVEKHGVYYFCSILAIPE